ncbi:MAG: methylmalonyl-CoA mutase family protein [Acidimicrobiia bacterium]
MPDQPWMMRTYSGYSSARASNALYRTNLAKGQTGLSVAFDLPTQTGYDPDHPLARGEVGKVGVPVPHLGEMRTLFESIPIETMNTSMTINATAIWEFACYLALADERGIPFAELTGTTQNDIMKEYLSRGTFIFPPDASLRLTTDLILYAVEHVPKWNPINICSYHLQEAGATPVQEIAFALATACDVLDAIRAHVAADAFAPIVGRVSFFVNAGIRFIEETCKMRAFARAWNHITEHRYGITDERFRRFRYGVQVNSLGLTESQPENNVVRIVLETLGVTLSRDARARAIQLPAWNEAIGLPRPWDQQWSLRIQQILAYETDLLDYADILAGSLVIESMTADLEHRALGELEDLLARGGAFANISECKARLVQSMAERVRRIESGEQTIVGVNRFTETEPSPLTAGAPDDIMVHVDEAAETEAMARLVTWRAAREPAEHAEALIALTQAARDNSNLVPVSIAFAQAGGTVGEWADALREVFGEYRAPTGIGGTVVAPPKGLRATHARVREASQTLGGPPRVLVAKPGLDGHSNGAEQIAVAARDAGLEVIYQGIRLTPEQIATAAHDEDVDVIGLSILSGSHRTLVPETLQRIRAMGCNAPLVVGGIVSETDRAALLAAGVARVYTPRDYRLADIIDDLAELALDFRRSRQ